jgi:vancomycin permeability regulator SanA
MVSPGGHAMARGFALFLGLVYRSVRAQVPVQTVRSVMVVTLFVSGVLFPLLQILRFGRTDHRRPADVAVVFGARVYADGRLSDAVGDRVAMAVELYLQGWVRELVMSGGPGDGAIHETAAMKAAAVRAGVPAAAIRCDPEGLSTAATVRNTAREFAGKRVPAVSGYYHLPPIKLAYAGAGVEVFTVPAQARTQRRAWDLQSVFREVPAFWVHFAGATSARPARFPPVPWEEIGDFHSRCTGVHFTCRHGPRNLGAGTADRPGTSRVPMLPPGLTASRSGTGAVHRG